MPDYGLVDLVSPMFLAGADFGPGIHALLSALYIDELNTAYDEAGVAFWGVARIDANHIDQLSFTPTANGFNFLGQTNDATHQTTSSDPNAIFDWHDVTVTFRFTSARQPSAMVQGIAGLPANLVTLFNAYGPGTGTATSDYPDTQFKIDLLLSIITIRIPGLRGADLKPDGTLVDTQDASKRNVKIKAPRLLIGISQGNGVGTNLNVTLESWGASGLDADQDL